MTKISRCLKPDLLVADLTGLVIREDPSEMSLSKLVRHEGDHPSPNPKVDPGPDPASKELPKFSSCERTVLALVSCAVLLQILSESRVPSVVSVRERARSPTPRPHPGALANTPPRPFAAHQPPHLARPHGPELSSAPAWREHARGRPGARRARGHVVAREPVEGLAA